MAGSKKGEETTGKGKAKLTTRTRRPATSTTAARDASAGTRARADRQADPSLAARTGRSAQAPAPTPPNRRATRSEGAAGPVAAAEEGKSGSSSKRRSPVFLDDKEAMAAAAAAAATKKPKKTPQLQPSAVTAAAAAAAAALKKTNVTPSPRLVPRAAAAGAVAAKTPPSMNMASAGTRARGDRQADYSLAARTRRNTQAPAPTPPHGPATRSQGAVQPVAAAEEGNSGRKRRSSVVFLDDKEAMAAAATKKPKNPSQLQHSAVTAAAAATAAALKKAAAGAVATKTPPPMIMARTGSGNTNMPRLVDGKGNMTAGARDSSSSSSHAGVQPCEDCFLPSQRVAHLCLRCYRSRRDCRTCRERCSPYKRAAAERAGRSAQAPPQPPIGRVTRSQDAARPVAAPAEGDKKKRDQPYLSTKKEKVIPLKLSEVTAAAKANKLRRQPDYVPRTVVSVAQTGSRSTNMMPLAHDTRLRSAIASASASSSRAAVLPCEDCYRPSEQQAHLCHRCYRSRCYCRTCQGRRERD